VFENRALSRMFGPKGLTRQETVENCAMRSVCTLRQIRRAKTDIVYMMLLGGVCRGETVCNT
jgi:hypothetical protein